MGTVEDLRGRKFGKLTVIERAPNKKDGSTQWYCRCDCGNKNLVVAIGTNLRSGHKKSCGCISKAIDLTGQKYGRLTVINRAENKTSKEVKWNCKCDCGNPKLITVSSTNLRKGNTKSCGCLSRENRHKLKRGPNKYEIFDGWVIGHTKSGKEFCFDEDDYNKVKDICWSLGANGYVVGTYNGKKVLMHRFIMEAKKGEVVDHINHSTVDNRKSNLRIVSHQENSQNKKPDRKNKSGFTGVSWVKKLKKWRASITIKYKSYNLGVYDTIEEAASVRKEAEEKYFGEYSYDNSMKISPIGIDMCEHSIQAVPNHG